MKHTSAVACKYARFIKLFFLCSRLPWPPASECWPQIISQCQGSHRHYRILKMSRKLVSHNQIYFRFPRMSECRRWSYVKTPDWNSTANTTRCSQPPRSHQPPASSSSAAILVCRRCPAAAALHPSLPAGKVTPCCMKFSGIF